METLMIKQYKKFLIFIVFILLLTAVPPIFADGDTYVVKAGDNLFRIALNHGVTVNELVQLNGIFDPTKIEVGQVLQIPGKLGISSTRADTPSVVVSTYTVQPGDTLFSISYRYGLLTTTVAAANGITDLNHVYTGQVLQIPAHEETAVSDDPPDDFSDDAVDDATDEVADDLPAIVPPVAGDGERWIDVNLSTQTLTAYESSEPVYHTAVSTGYWPYLTVTGEFSVYSRYEAQTMNGYALGFDYYLPDVPYVMYFYGNYALHGTYWHNNFGTEMSHGCVNLATSDAEWIYNWSAYGTIVKIHY